MAYLTQYSEFVRSRCGYFVTVRQRVENIAWVRAPVRRVVILVDVSNINTADF